MTASMKTEQQLALAMKQLMREMPFEKISVSDITGRAGMGRNTFYYHFKDKYDLVNTIFEKEVLQILQQKPDSDNWADFLHTVGEYVRDNDVFYRNALSYSGQNSLRDHIFHFLKKRLLIRIGEISENLKLPMSRDELEFTAAFFASALEGLLTRSVTQNELIYLDQYRECVRRICNGTLIEDYLRSGGTEQEK